MTYVNVIFDGIYLQFPLELDITRLLECVEHFLVVLSQFIHPNVEYNYYIIMMPRGSGDIPIIQESMIIQESIFIENLDGYYNFLTRDANRIFNILNTHINEYQDLQVSLRPVIQR